MATQSYQSQLEELQTCISDILTNGERTTFNGRTVEFSDLEWLQKREEWLRKMVARESRGGMRVRGATPVSVR